MALTPRDRHMFRAAVERFGPLPPAAVDAGADLLRVRQLAVGEHLLRAGRVRLALLHARGYARSCRLQYIARPRPGTQEPPESSASSPRSDLKPEEPKTVDLYGG